jgi:hypothetical protein
VTRSRFMSRSEKPADSASPRSARVSLSQGAFSTLTKVCEDLPKELDIEISGQRLLDFMIPRFIQFTDHPSAKFRTQAISCLNSFIITQPPSLNTNIDAFFTALFRRASDENSDVRKAVCQALTLLLSTRPDKIVPELPNVAEFMIYSMQDKDESVALEACEFWLGFAEADELKDHLKPFLGKVAPVLLNGMVYSEADLIWLDGDDDDDAAVPDRPEDIKPKFYGGKGHGFEHDSADPSSSGGKSRALGEDGDDDEDDDDYDDDSDDDEDDFSSEWNLRKCSAAALDVMSVVFDVDLLEILLPHLKDKLFSQEWTERECGILALGAMAEGCLDGITPHLPTLVPLLLSTLADPKVRAFLRQAGLASSSADPTLWLPLVQPLVRAITCWTLGRYSSWCVNASTTAEAQAQFFLPTMEGLLKAVLDNNKRVQEAGCSAFATLEEEAGARLQPFLDPIIRNLAFAFSKYQQKNLFILYDAIGTLADSVGEGLNDPNLVGLLMPPMIEKWNALGDDDEAIIPLLEVRHAVQDRRCAGADLALRPPVPLVRLDLGRRGLRAVCDSDLRALAQARPEVTGRVHRLPLGSRRGARQDVPHRLARSPLGPHAGSQGEPFEPDGPVRHAPGPVARLDPAPPELSRRESSLRPCSSAIDADDHILAPAPFSTPTRQSASRPMPCSATWPSTAARSTTTSRSTCLVSRRRSRTRSPSPSLRRSASATTLRGRSSRLRCSARPSPVRPRPARVD